jgi:predicted O-methyltransferase YrrM
MTIGGTGEYADRVGLPPLVGAAVEAAVRLGFGYSCRPEQGELMRVLAGGVPDGGRIGETGTGCGVGLAWLASGARPGVRMVSVEVDADRADAARALFAATDGGVEVVTGDASDLSGYGPFDLLVLDGGPGSGKTGDTPIEPATWLRPDGVLVIDDFTPMTTWPPYMSGTGEGTAATLDAARLHWLTHPDLLATEIRITPGAATIVGRLRPVRR